MTLNPADLALLEAAGFILDGTRILRDGVRGELHGTGDPETTTITTGGRTLLPFLRMPYGIKSAVARFVEMAGA